jgi:hypothetical protein
MRGECQRGNSHAPRARRDEAILREARRLVSLGLGHRHRRKFGITRDTIVATIFRRPIRSSDEVEYRNG